ncbi:MAG: FHA domain-containing protein [Clostridium sp.]|nr:FHA domain-containing protein [Clostridium sp.]
MDLRRILGLIFTVLFVIILFYIILKSLNLMIRDMRHSSKEDKVSFLNLKVIGKGKNENINIGSTITVKEEATFGRESDNTVVLKDPYTSGYHTRIYRNKGRFVIEDLESTNGTLLNGDLLDVKTYLEDGDVIWIGKLKLEVVK